MRSAIANVPKKKNANASAIVNEYSPASVLASVAAHDALVERDRLSPRRSCPGSPVKNRNDVAATANAAGVGLRRAQARGEDVRADRDEHRSERR